MGLFSSKHNTISDKQMRDIQRRAQWANRKESWISDKAIKRRLAMRENAKKARWN